MKPSLTLCLSYFCSIVLQIVVRLASNCCNSQYCLSLSLMDTQRALGHRVTSFCSIFFKTVKTTTKNTLDIPVEVERVAEVVHCSLSEGKGSAQEMALCWPF